MRDLLTKDVRWKVFSLALATLVWLMVKHETTAPASRTFPNVPVLVVSAAADVREFRVNPDAVRVTVSGRPGVVGKLDPRDIHAVVDLTGSSMPQDLIKRVDVSVPAGVTVVKVTPAEVAVILPPKWEN